MAAVVQCRPADLGRFLDMTLKPGAAIRQPATLVVAALHVAAEFHRSRAVGVADVTEQEGAKSHVKRPDFF